MNSRRWFAVKLISLVAIIFLSGWRVVTTVQGALSPARPPSVLIVSVCSFQKQLLQAYGSTGESLMPNLDRFFSSSSFVFENAVNGLPWTSIFGVTRVRLPISLFDFAGYALPGWSESGQMMRVPWRRSLAEGSDRAIVNDSDFEKDYASAVKDVELAVNEVRQRPFFMIAHFKYMHYPLIDRFNGDSKWDQFLSSDERALVVRYLENPERYYKKLPFLLMLANNPAHALFHPEVKRRGWGKDPQSILKLAGLITSPEFLDDWKKSPQFDKDQIILEKIYRANARYLDSVLAPVLDLWGDKELQKNTVVIFAGDHGELHMQHDELTHGNSLWEEAVRVPLAVRFPEEKEKPQKIEAQMHFGGLTEVLRGFLRGRNAKSDFGKLIEENHDDVMIGRDCLNTLRGLRFENRYKYFVRIRDGSRFLYDLQTDPNEQQNLAEQKPELTVRMETLYWENYPRFVDWDPYRCAPWATPTGDQAVTVPKIDKTSSSTETSRFINFNL